MNATPTVVLVDGAWADGSSWSRVIAELQQGGISRHRRTPPADLTR